MKNGPKYNTFFISSPMVTLTIPYPNATNVITILDIDLFPIPNIVPIVDNDNGAIPVSLYDK